LPKSRARYGDSNCDIGWESVADYICALVDVFEAIPLNPWASVWVNIGDTRGPNGELLGIPRHFVTEMEKRGYLLINEVIWVKVAVQVDGTTIGHFMIEPASGYGRLNGNGFEPMFHFVKNPKEAWSDPYAVSIPRKNVPDVPYLPEELMRCHTSIEGRNLANVWLIPTGQSRKKHWATYPAALVERPIAMTCPPAITSEGPRERLGIKEPYDEGRSFKRGIGKYGHEDAGSMSGRHDTGREYVPRKPKTIGWTLSGLPSVPGIVLDPFCGTGTTGEAAIRLGRRFIGIELYPDYAAMAVERCKAATRVYELNLKALAADPSFTTTSGIVHVASSATDEASGAMLVAQTFETTFGRPPSVLAVADLN
jgi:site-specific DNA-methyltransferase (adenine-specific)